MTAVRGIRRGRVRGIRHGISRGNLLLGMFGQSNTLGLSPVAGLSDEDFETPYTAVQMVHMSADAADDPVPFVDYGTEDLQPWGDNTTMGPELSLGRDLTEQGGTWSLCKVAVNNSSIGDGSAGSNWHPDADYPASGDNLLTRAMDYTTAALSAQGASYAGTFWGQGERDADTVFAPDYCQNLTALHTALCARFGTKPFIFTRLHPDSDAADTAVVRAQQALFAATTPLVSMVNTDDLVLFDSRHFDADSQVTIGQRSAAAYAAMTTPTSLFAAITASDDPVDAGTEMDYLITITAGSAVNVGVEIILPATAVYVSGSGSGWTVTEIDSRIIATRATLVGASPVLTITVEAPTDAGDATAEVNVVASNSATMATDEVTIVVEPGSTWAVDATSGLPRPANAAEWGNLLTSLSAGAGPTHAYLCQEASGDLADSVGSLTLADTGSPTYSNVVTGQAAGAVGFSGAVAERFSNGAGPSPATTSVLQIAVVQLDAAPAAESTLFGLATGFYATQHTTGIPRAFIGATGGGLLASSHTGLTVLAVRHDRTAGASDYFSNLEKATLVYDSGGVGTLAAGIGGVDGTGFTTHTGAHVLLCAIFTGSAAEKTNTQIKALIASLSGTTPPWSP